MQTEVFYLCSIERLQRRRSNTTYPIAAALQCCSQRGVACSPMRQVEQQIAMDTIHLRPQAILLTLLVAYHPQAWTLFSITIHALTCTA